MEILSTSLDGVQILVPRLFKDARGHFFESFNQERFVRDFGDLRFCQDNESFSKRGVLRGIHYQLDTAAQTKLVRVIEGAVWDVAVDLRIHSPTFKSWVGMSLTAENKKQFLIPRGFGHGFLVTSETAIVQYKVDNYYSANFDRGIRFDDPDLAIQWPMTDPLILSEKDQSLPYLKSAELFR